MTDIVYFELNNWFAGRDYPNCEPFKTWIAEPDNYIDSNEWAKDNKICIIAGPIDMSFNWCITAPKEWVLKNCPEILSHSDYSTDFIQWYRGENKIVTENYNMDRFLREPDENGDVFGRFGWKFLPWAEKNFGIAYYADPYWDNDWED